jgi:hypothetical protein
MCRNLTVLCRNEFKQVVLICEHDTLHLVHHYTTILLTREAFFQLDQLLQSRCLTDSNGQLRCKTTDEGYIELWIGMGAFRLLPAELMALAKLVRYTAERLRLTPLDELLHKENDETGLRRHPQTTSPNLN